MKTWNRVDHCVMLAKNNSICQIDIYITPRAFVNERQLIVRTAVLFWDGRYNHKMLLTSVTQY